MIQRCFRCADRGYLARESSRYQSDGSLAVPRNPEFEVCYCDAGKVFAEGVVFRARETGLEWVELLATDWDTAG